MQFLYNEYPKIGLLVLLFLTFIPAYGIYLIIGTCEKFRKKIERFKVMDKILDNPDAAGMVKLLRTAGFTRGELIIFMKRLGRVTDGITKLHFTALELFAEFRMLSSAEYLDIYNATEYLSCREQKDFSEMLENNCKDDLQLYKLM